MKRKLILTIILLVIPCYLLLIPLAFSFSPTTPNLYEGIDVSGWQGNIDYTEVKKAGIEIVYMKTSEGSNFVDPYFNQNYNNAKANGLKVGFYHYLTAQNTNEAIEQANFFVATIAGKSPDCLLCMDFESFGNLSKQQINEIALTFLREVERLSGKKAVVYSDTYNAQNTFSGEITNNPLWVAEYEVEEPIPNGNWENWVGWQYTNQGSVPRH